MRRAGLSLLVVCVLAVSSAHGALAQTWKIAFNRDTDTGYQLFTISPDGTGLAQLTGGTDVGHNWAPCWSPGGQYLCFCSTRTGHTVLFTMDMATGALQQVTTGHDDQSPHWSWAPGLNKLVFARVWAYEGQEDYGLRVRDMTTGQETLLLKGGSIGSPTWSPDGSLILYKRATTGLYVIPAQGGAPVLAFPDSGSVYQPAWSPAGGQIVVRDHAGGYYLYVAPIGDETGAVGWEDRWQLPGTYDASWPTWSPDGQYIAYETHHAVLGKNGKLIKTVYDIWTVKADGTEDPVYLTEGRYPEWSPILGNQPPVAVAGGSYQAELGQPVALDGTGSYHPDPDGELLGFVWDFGDGSNSGWYDAPITTVEHVYPAVGVYEPLLLVFDTEGLFGSDVAQVTIAGGPDQPGVAEAGGPYYAQLGQTITFDGSASFDPNGADLQYLWDFGDGTNSGWLAGPVATYLYAAGGNYAVTLTVFDGTGPSDPDATVAYVTAEMHVSRIDMTNGGSQGNKRSVRATVYVVDDLGDPVVGAAVTGQWTWVGGSLAPKMLTTDASGRITDWTGYLSAISGKVLTYTVQGIVKTGWTYDDLANVETSDTYLVP